MNFDAMYLSDKKIAGFSLKAIIKSRTKQPVQSPFNLITWIVSIIQKTFDNE